MATIRDKSDKVQDRIDKVESVTIESGQTESEGVNCLGTVLTGIQAPAVMTGTSFTFKVSDDGVTYIDYYNTAGNQLTTAVNAGKWTGIKPVDFAGVQWVKLVSSSAEAAQREITLTMRGM